MTGLRPQKSKAVRPGRALRSGPLGCRLRGCDLVLGILGWGRFISKCRRTCTVPCAGLTRLGGARRGWDGGQGSADPQKYNRSLACNFQFSVVRIEKVKRKQIEVHFHYIFYSASVSQMSSFPTCM